MSLAFDYRSVLQPPVEPTVLKRVLAGLGPAVGTPQDSQLESLPTGFDELDSLLPEGGFPAGRLTELRGSAGSGKLSLALGAVRAALVRSQPVAFVDVSCSFVPPITTDAVYEDLLVVRVAEPRLALQALDSLLRTGVFPLVVLDLSTTGRAPHPTRLAREARINETALVVLSDQCRAPLMPTATLRLEVARLEDALHVTLSKNKLGPPGASLQIPLAEHHNRLQITQKPKTQPSHQEVPR